MAIIKCPSCGQDVSDKTKKCIHCGETLLEETVPKRVCSECGKEVEMSVLECPHCGYSLQQDEKEKTKKKAISVVVIIILILAIITVIGLMKSSLNEDEKLAYQNAVTLKDRMKNPDSFKLYDEFFLLKHHNDDGVVDYTYTIFKYGGTNDYGAMTADEAIFKDDKYIMDYADDLDTNLVNRAEQTETRRDLLKFTFSGENDTWEKVDINIEKIKRKMKLE